MKRDRVTKNCTICDRTFETVRSAANRRLTCGDSACSLENRRRKMLGNQLRLGRRPSNSFEPGHQTWNKGLSGLRLSPATEFKKGVRGIRWVPLGTVSIRIHRGVRRAWVKIGEPNIWRERAKIVWESKHGPIPLGMVVHHDDRDTLNDDHINLILVTRADHLREHRAEIEQARRAGLASAAAERHRPAGDGDRSLRKPR